MAYELKKGGLPAYGMPLKNEIGDKPEKAPFMGFGPPPGGPGGPNNDPTDDPMFPRSFKMIPSYVIENNVVLHFPQSISWRARLAQRRQRVSNTPPTPSSSTASL